MLEDRHYMRPQFDRSHLFGRLPISLWLVILNVAFYAAQLIVPLAGGTPGIRPPRLEIYLALDPDDVMKGWVWQLLTFQLLHGGSLHLLINCAMLYIFGRPVENAIGRGNFLKLYFGGGTFGGLLQIAFSLVFKEHFGYRESFGWPPVLGASAGVFGLIAAFATLNSETPITMLLAFIIPVTMKAKYLLLVEVVLAVLGMLDARSGIAHAAHLGGMIAGFLYIRHVSQCQWHWPRFGRSFRRRPLPRELVSVQAQTAPLWRRPSPRATEELPTDEFLSKEVDPILDKISAHGIQSLTDRERKILETARARMAKR
jgi:membrane associated rhomboid family serine protease